MNSEHWKKALGQLKGSIKHQWGQLHDGRSWRQLNDEVFRSLGKAQGGVSRRLRTLLGTAEMPSAANEAVEVTGESRPVAPPVPARDLHAAHDQHSNGG